VRIQDCYLVGYITKPHGLAGEVSVFLDVDIPSEYESIPSYLVLMDNSLVPFHVKQCYLSGNKTANILFDGFKNIEDTSLLIGKEIYLPLSSLKPLKGEKSFYFFEIIGFTLTNSMGETLGVVSDVLEFGSNIVLSVIDIKTKEEVLVPLADDLLNKVDHENKVLNMHVPDGLFPSSEN
jgi:16S rRNA processing protein RimM